MKSARRRLPPALAPAGGAPRPEGERPAPSSSREVAYLVVGDVFGPELRGAQAAFDVRSRRAGLDARDRAFAAELAYGSIKGRRRIDWELEPFIGGREKLDVSIREVLRLGAYQARMMTGVEDHAVVSETVNLAWRHGHRGTAGLVNAVLRRMLAEGPRPLDRAAFEREADYRGVAYSTPSWIAAIFASALGDDAEAALAGINRPPQAAIRVNTLRSDVDAVIAALAAREIEASVSGMVPESLLLPVGTVLDDPDGRWSVQGEVSAMAVDLLAPRPGETVVDLCSGRGTKAVGIAGRMRNEGSLTCVEIDPRKVRLLEEALERSGVAIAAVVRGDAVDAAAEVAADAVLLDAPCSGLGVLGRHPEARWRKTPEDGARLAASQRALIRSAARRLKPGGRLVYGVCSIDPREGREIVDGLLAERGDLARAPLPERYAAFERGGDVLVAPGIAGRDGFSYAVLART